MALSAKDLLKKLKENTLDKTTLDERLVGMAKRYIPAVGAVSMANKAINAPRPDVSRFAPQYNQLRNTLKQPAPQFLQKPYQMAQSFNNSVLGAPGRVVMGKSNSAPGRWIQGYQGAVQDSVSKAGQAFDKNFSQIQQGQTLKQRLPTIASGGWNTAKALSQVTPKGLATMAIPSVIGGGVAKLQGQDPFVGAGRSAGEFQGWRPVLNVTDPLTAKTSQKAVQLLTNRGASRLAKIPLKQLATQQVAQRATTGIGNTIEDEILDRLDQRQRTNTDRLASFAIGGAMGGNSQLLDQAKKRLTDTDIKQVAKELNVSAEKVKQVYQDEDGNWKTRFNPEKALAGMAMVGGVKAVKGKLKLNQSQLPKSEAIKGKVQLQPPELPKQVVQTTSSPSLDTTRTGNIPITQVKQAQTLPIQQDSRLIGADTKLDTNQNLKIKTTKVSSNESIPPTLKPKTQLLKQAEELRNTGFQELTANRELAQLNQVKREMFSSKQIKDINRLKAIARSNKALEGDIETLRKLTPDGLTDRVLEYVEEATAIKGQGNEEQLLETALSLPTKADTKVKLPVEIKNARELEKQANKLRDLVYNSETDPNIKAKAVADNQKVIQKSAVSDYKEWEKQLFKQESAKKMTPNRQATIASSQIRTSTKPEFAKPENISKTQDISNAGKGMTDVYRNVDRVFGKDSQVRKQILAPFDTAKANMVDDLEREATGLETNIVKKYGFTKGSAESEYIQKYGEGLVTKPQLIERFGKKKAEQIVEANTWFRSQYDRLLDEVNAVRARIYPNNPEKQIQKRKDYYRHFQDLSSSLAGLKNLFENPAGIEPGLAGVSEYTVPKSKWLSFAQKRLGMKTEYDAVGGYLDYVGSQTYAKRIDPFIEKFRALRQELVDATSVEGDKNYGKLNNFIEFLDDYANDLAGKTNPADRVAQKYMGRKVFKILNWVNSRTKANVIVGNLSSSIAQFFNIPQGVAEAGVVNSGKGAVRTLGSILDNTNTPITKSEFIKTRFSKDISDRFDIGVLSNVKKTASWITGVGDEIGTKFIWNSVYEKAISQNIENPIKYADDITRKMVAGRGIGEVPLLQKSKTFQLLAPFQLEVSNVWHVMRDWAGEKAANKFVTFFVASYLMNRMAEKIRGNDVSFDPIQAGIEAIEAYAEEDDKTLGVLRAGGRLFGEVLSNLPGGQTVAAMYPEYGATIGDTKLPTREKLFGEGDPTRFGSGLLASKGLTDPLYKIIPPYGGAQIKKTIEGLGTINKGYSESKTGRVRFPVDKNLINTVQAGAFGQYSVPEARAYFKNKGSVMGEKQSATFKSLPQQERLSFFNSRQERLGKTDTISVTGGQSIPTDQKTFSELYKDASSKSKYLEKYNAIQYDPTLDDTQKQEKVSKLRDEASAWGEVLAKMERENPEMVFTAQIETYKTGSGKSVDERGEWVYKKLETAQDEKELQSWINRLWEEKVITSGSSGVAQYLEDTYGINVRYTGTSKKIKGSKKIKLGSTPQIRSPMIKFSAPQGGGNITMNIPKLNIQMPKTNRVKVRPSIDLRKVRFV